MKTTKRLILLLILILCSLAVFAHKKQKNEDIKNTTESLVEKVGQLQLEFFNHSDKDLEKVFAKLNNDFSNAHLYITEIWHEYEIKVAQLKK